MTMRLWWRAADPDAVVALLESLGLSLSDGNAPLGPAVLSVVAVEGGGVDRLEVGDPAPDGVRPNREPSGPRLAALGWATVDAERLAAQLGKPLTDEPQADPALGATGYRVASANLPLVLLEPVTEGRMAAALARLGEGPVALYLDGITLRPADDATPLASTGTGRQGRLLRPAQPSGPFVIALEW
jgi:hypothetical protein